MVESDKRSETRLQEQATIYIELYDQQSEQATNSVIICNSLDISANGIQFQIDQALPPGSILRLVAELPDKDEPLQLVGEVKWATADQEDFNIGFELYDAEHTDIITWKQLIAERLG